MQDSSSIFDLKGQRVRVTRFSAPEVVGVLRGITESRLWIGEEPVEHTDIADVSAAPLYCETCRSSVYVLYEGLCASCSRKRARSRPPVQEPCAVCGAPGIRNPGTNEFLCATHHAKAGNSLRLSGSSGNVLAACLTEDATSDKHEWAQVRGARFRCIRCRRAEKWDPDLLRQLQNGSE